MLPFSRLVAYPARRLARCKSAAPTITRLPENGTAQPSMPIAEPSAPKPLERVRPRARASADLSAEQLMKTSRPVKRETNRVAKLVTQPLRATDKTLASYGAFMFDMDGVLQRCGVAIDGAGGFLRRLRQLDIPFVVITNECRFTNDTLGRKLGKLLDVEIEPEEIYTAANSCRDFFVDLRDKGAFGSVYVIGEEGLLGNMQEAFRADVHGPGRGRVYTGSDIWSEHEGHPPISHVVIGSVWNESTRNLERAAHFINDGAKLLYTCPDWFARDDDGKYEFGCPMSAVNLLQQVCNVSAYNTGKPNARMFRMAFDSVYARRKPSLPASVRDREGVMFVGDSLDTDIRIAMENGVDSALVMSGTATDESLRRSALVPSFVFQSIDELWSTLDREPNADEQ